MTIYNLFISHAWQYSERYEGIVRLLDSVPSFQWRDYSAPRDYPVVEYGTRISAHRLTELLDQRIRSASCFLLVAGMFVDHRTWVQTEIDIAMNYSKPIVGVRRRGQKLTPQTVIDVADEMVNWNAASIVAAIRSAVGY